MNVRPARYEDCRFVYDLSQSEDVRAMSTRSDAFTYEEHCQWWNKRFNCSTTRFYIAEKDEPVGYVRYGRSLKGQSLYTGGPVLEQDMNHAEVSIAIIAGERGHGYGKQLLTQSGELCDLPVSSFMALVLPENRASIRLFLSAGYQLIGETYRLGKQHWVYTKDGCRTIPMSE